MYYKAEGNYFKTCFYYVIYGEYLVDVVESPVPLAVIIFIWVVSQRETYRVAHYSQNHQLIVVFPVEESDNELTEVASVIE